MTRIRSLHCTPFEIPYLSPLKMKAGDLRSARHVLVTVRLESGIEGIAEAPERPMFYGETIESIVAAVQKIIWPRISSLAHCSRNSVRKALEVIRANHTARAAVEMAYTDALAREAGVSVAALLGGTDVPVRVTHMLGADGPAQMADEALAAAQEHGIECFKAKIGYGPEADLASVRAVREAVGEQATIYVDGNLAYSADEGYVVLRSLRDEAGVQWAEEPYAVNAMTAGDPPAMPVPVMTDETTIDPVEAGRHMSTGRAQKISIKVARTGYAASADIVGLGRYFGCQPLLGSQGDALIGTFSGLAFASAQADELGPFAELSYFMRLADDITVERPRIADGRLVNTFGDGIGLTVDADKLARYRMEV